jgi:hypothetical protein
VVGLLPPQPPRFSIDPLMGRDGFFVALSCGFLLSGWLARVWGRTRWVR